MFYHFFEEYKEEIYKGLQRKLKWYEVLLLALTIICLLLFLLGNILHWATVLEVILISLPIMIIAGECIFLNQYRKKNRKDLLADYKEKSVKLLCNQLEEYKLYTDDGIDWLIDCCKEERDKNQQLILWPTMKNAFMGIIYPLITLSLGLALKDSTSNEIISFLAELIAAFLIGSIVILFAKSVVLFMLFPDRDVVNHLESELKYIKTGLVKEQ